MTAYNAKTERNDEIKRLYKQGMNQYLLADKFGVTQARISCIIFDRLPRYRCCRYCRAHCPGSMAVCKACVATRAEARLRRKELKYARRDLLKVLRRVAAKIKTPAQRFLYRGEVVPLQRNIKKHFRDRRRDSLFKESSELHAI